MVVTIDTPITGTDDLTAAWAIAVVLEDAPDPVRINDIAPYLTELYLLCKAYRLVYRLLIAQAWLETGAFGRAGRWDELNPAGLGITGPDDPTPYRIATGPAAARLHVWTMLVALRRWGDADGLGVPAGAEAWRDRWTAKYRDSACPVVRTLGDLNQVYSGNRATWAVDPAYGRKVANVANALFPGALPGEEEEPMTLNMDPTLIPFPAFEDRLIPDRDTHAWSRLGPRTVKGFVLHRMLGSLDGTDAYFRSGAGGLTDFGQDSKTGLVYRWNDPDGAAHDGVSPDRSGWASGSVILPYGDGLAFVRKYGIEAVNRDQLSWEIDGFYGDAWSEAAMQIAAQACAANAQEYGIPWDAWPIAPRDGFSFVRWHQEFTGPQEKACPGAVVMGQTADFIEVVRVILREHQTGTVGEPQPAPPRYAPLAVPTFLTPAWIAGGEDASFENGTKVFSCRRRWQARVTTPRMQHAGIGAPDVGPLLPAGKTTIGVGLYHSHGRWLILTEWGERLDMADMTDKLMPGYWDQPEGE